MLIRAADKEWDNLEDNLDEIKKQQNGFLLYVSADECFPQDQVIAYEEEKIEPALSGNHSYDR